MVKLLLLSLLFFNNLIHTSHETSAAIIPYQEPFRIPTQEEINLQKNATILMNAEFFNNPAFIKSKKALRKKEADLQKNAAILKNAENSNNSAYIKSQIALRKKEELRLKKELELFLKKEQLSSMLEQKKREQTQQKHRLIGRNIDFYKVLRAEEKGTPLDSLAQVRKIEKKDAKFGTRTEYTISPTNQPYNEEATSMYEQEIHIYTVHGTKSNDASYLGNPEKPLSQELSRFGQQLSAAIDTPVIMHGFKWSSDLDETQRDKAGNDLAHEIITIENNRKEQGLSPARYWFIGHSHGNNVTNNAAQYLRNHNIPIDVSVMMASPVLDKNPIKNDDGTYGVDSIINIYGRNDMVGCLGSGLTTSFQQGTLRKDYVSATNESVRNVALIENGKHLNHITIKQHTIHNLAKIIATMNEPSNIVPGNIIINIKEDTIQIAKDPKDPLNIENGTYEGIRHIRDYAGLSSITQQSKDVATDFTAQHGGSIYYNPNPGDRVADELGTVGGKTAKGIIATIQDYWPEIWRSQDDIDRRKHKEDFAASPKNIATALSSSSLNDEITIGDFLKIDDENTFGPAEAEDLGASPILGKKSEIDINDFFKIDHNTVRQAESKEANSDTENTFGDQSEFEKITPDELN